MPYQLLYQILKTISKRKDEDLARTFTSSLGLSCRLSCPVLLPFVISSKKVPSLWSAEHILKWYLFKKSSQGRRHVTGTKSKYSSFYDWMQAAGGQVDTAAGVSKSLANSSKYIEIY